MSSNITSEEVADVEGGAAETTNHPDSSRSYGGAMVYQRRSTILCSLTGLVLVGVAIGLSVISVQQSNEALALARESLEATEDMENDLQMTNEAVVDAVEGWEQRPEPAPAVPAAPIATPPPSPKPTSAPTTAAPTTPAPTEPPSESHPLDPKWYHTSHKDYQLIIENEDIGGMSPYLRAGTFCARFDRTPCGYDEYCPNGKGGRPYRGGPPQTEGWEDRKQEQWSPIAAATEEEGFQWVQVGSVPPEDGGKDGSQCVKWKDFEYGNGQDILEVRGEPYMQWMLCCLRES